MSSSYTRNLNSGQLGPIPSFVNATSSRAQVDDIALFVKRLEIDGKKITVVFDDDVKIGVSNVTLNNYGPEGYTPGSWTAQFLKEQTVLKDVISLLSRNKIWSRQLVTEPQGNLEFSSLNNIDVAAVLKLINNGLDNARLPENYDRLRVRENSIGFNPSP